ncbi:MAG: hypothetical protein CVT64_01505 [Actinobacteria bacterium HGW-Actinobacteria-4]|nr:MAG: hypothetical protein CVT64_01505 [Actinobacteria bacterium HGW-Actinobacteria-4]
MMIPVVMAVSIALGGCGGDDAPPTGTGTTSTGQEPATGVTATPGETDDAVSDPGTATLTVGELTFEFDNFRCALGHDNTASDAYSFTSDARGATPEGVALQLQANVRDTRGLGRLEGEGVIHEISIQDIDHPNDPIMGLVATSEGFLGSDAVIAIDGDALIGSGAFLDNQITAAVTHLGTLVATCSSDSLT